MLSIGQHAPHFHAPDQNGQRFDSSDWVGKKPFVIYFYPANETYHCIKEACAFRDQYNRLQESGLEVIGVSGNSVEGQQKFSEQRELPFILLSDPDRSITKAFEVKASMFGFLPGRVTYLINAKGVVEYAFSSQFDILKHINGILEASKKYALSE